MTSRLISERDHSLLRRYDKKEPAYQMRLLDENGAAYFGAFLAVLKSVTKDEPVQYALALLDEALSRDGASARHFFDASSPDPYGPLVRLLTRPDWFTEEKAAQVLSAALLARPRSSREDAPPPAMDALLAWLAGQLRRPSHPRRAVPAAVHCLSLLLREPAARPRADAAGISPMLAGLVRYPGADVGSAAPGGVDGGAKGGVPSAVSFAFGSSSSASSSSSRPLDVQLLYESILSLWELSWYAPALARLATPQALTGLVDTVRLARKEKLVRVSLLALQRLLGAGEQALELVAVGRGLGRVLETRKAQSWDDQDVPALLEALSTRLQEGVAGLGSFERYKREVLSGTLTWSPAHRDDDFWRVHAELLVDSDASLLKRLVALLQNPAADPLTLAVACSDVAHFVAAYPHGRGVLAELGAKGAVMRLMAHPDAAVQREALVAVQRILLSKDKADTLESATHAAKGQHPA